MGCQGGNRWKIYRIHSFQDKFLLLELSLIFHNKYYKRYIFPSRYLAVVAMVIEKLLLSYHATVFFLIISHLPPGHPIISSEFKMAAVSVKRSIMKLPSSWVFMEG